MNSGESSPAPVRDSLTLLAEVSENSLAGTVTPSALTAAQPHDSHARQETSVAAGETRPAWKVRLLDYWHLSKPRIAFLVLVTVAAGAYAAGKGSPTGWTLLNAMWGTGLVAAAASIFNQVIERDSDARMRRTCRRPLPAGRLAAGEVAVVASLIGLGGLLHLWLLTNTLAAGIALASFLLYLLVYTPMKRYTAFNTVVGAVPGALPPVIGWAAVRGEVSLEAWVLFLIVFLWQFPHFYAIAWLYREDYTQGGLRMLPGTPLGERLTGWVSIGFCLVLLPASFCPVLLGMVGEFYGIISLVLGVAFLGYAWAFTVERSPTGARGMMYASLLYLPLLLAALMFDLHGPKP